MSKPLTDEQVWGEPKEQLPEQEPKNYFNDFIDIYGDSIGVPGEVKDGISKEEKKEQS